MWKCCKFKWFLHPPFLKSVYMPQSVFTWCAWKHTCTWSMFARFHGNHSDAARSQPLWEIHLHPRSIFHSLKFLSSEINTWRHITSKSRFLGTLKPGQQKGRNSSESSVFLIVFPQTKCDITCIYGPMKQWSTESVCSRLCLVAVGTGKWRTVWFPACPTARPDCRIHDMGTDWSGRGANSIIPPLQS